MWRMICVENGTSMFVRSETAKEAREWWNDENNPHGYEIYSHPYIYEIKEVNPNDYPDYEKMDLINPE